MSLSRPYSGSWRQALPALIALTGAVLCAAPAPAADAPCPALARSVLPIDMDVPFVAPAFRGGDSLHLAYELHLSNFRPIDLRLERVEVFAPEADGRIFAALAESTLAAHIWNPGQRGDSAGLTLLRGGERAAIFLWIDFPAGETPPGTLAHRVACTVPAAPDARERIVEGACIAVPEPTRLLLKPPVPPGRWFFGNGPSPGGEHRSFLMAIDGRVRNAQRFASDWILLGEDGRVGEGDLKENATWRTYGTPVLAAADGVIRGIVDGLPENVPLAERAASANTRDAIAGNYVMQDLGDGAYAFYAHLLPGSIRVREGERVRAGAVLGRMGNSGNSDAPHLHFHVCDGPDPLASEGIPYAFTEFARLHVPAPAEVDSLFSGGQMRRSGAGTPRMHERELPVGETLVIETF